MSYNDEFRKQFITKPVKGAAKATIPTILLVDRNHSAYTIKRVAFRLGWTLAEVDDTTLWAFAPSADLSDSPTVSVEFDPESEHIEYAMLGSSGVAAPKLGTIIRYITKEATA